MRTLPDLQFCRLTPRSATGTAQRAVPTRFLVTMRVRSAWRFHKKITTLLWFVVVAFNAKLHAAEVIQADVCIYGGTAAGVAAAVETARLGHTAVIAEF